MSSAEALFFAHPFWVWIAIGGVFLIGELLSGSGWLLWPAGAAAAVAVVTRLADLSWPVQIVLFVVVAILATYLGRRYLPPAPKGKGDINDPAPLLVGKEGRTVEAFHGGRGRVFVDGKEWSAELAGDDDLAASAKVEVVEILGGARLKVRAAAGP
jgi:membrane protein implicated in regulation of membrane protease activity